MDDCPEQFEVCYTEEEFNEILTLMEENGVDYSRTPLSDVEAASNLVFDILFLNPIDLIYIGISMSVLATYGLSIYYVFKWIQRKFR